MALRGYLCRVAPALLPFAAVVALELLQGGAHAAVPQAAASKSIWAGVFTETQAQRGQSIYRDECARCHSDTLAGGESSPALVGDTFFDEWNGMTVADLFERMRKTMPEDSPGRLSGKQYANIIAYMFKVNAVPAGADELDADATSLKSIKIDKVKPPSIQ
jgi:mono/diheme cytochrome c family protein